MGDRVSAKFRILLEERKLLKSNISRKIIEKEIRAAESDLRDARDSQKQDKFKWATIQGYYSMFHSARALIFHRGYREKSHYAMLIALRDLFSRELGTGLIGRFEDSMDLRQEADYGLKFSQTGALDTIEGAEEFLKKAKELLKIK